jgi:plasmid stability protein
MGAAMPNLSIKDVPEAWAQALRERAARNHRSLQGELMALIQGAVAPPLGPPTQPNGISDSLLKALAVSSPDAAGRRGTVVGFDRLGHPITRHGWKTVEQVVAELKAKYPDGPVPGQASSLDMIREDRDRR